MVENQNVMKFDDKHAQNNESDAPKKGICCLGGDCKNKKVNKKYLIIGLIAGIAAILLIFVFINGFGMYKNAWEGNVTKKITSIIPYPIVSVNFQSIPYSRFIEEVNMLDNLNKEQAEMQGQPAPQIDRKDLRSAVVNQYITLLLIEQGASAYGIKLTDDEINKKFEEYKGNFPTEEIFKETIEGTYGWTFDIFKERVVKFALLQEKLTEKIANDFNITENKKAKEKIEDIKNRLDKGEDFATIASSESEDVQTSQNGGDLGYFGKGMMVQEFEDAAFILEKDSISDIIKTAYGYHIIKVTDKRTNEETGEEEVKASHILVLTYDINDYLRAAQERARIIRFISPDNLQAALDVGF